MKLDPKRTAFLTLDLQMGIFGFAPAAEAIMPTAAKAVEAARAKGLRVIHVGLGFAPGYPEIAEVDTPFQRVRKSGLFEIGSPSAAVHPSVFREGDLMIFKQRVGGFSENQLQLVLRSLGIDTLVLAGIATSGIVLSTLRRAFDLDFRSVVIKDACFDNDPEVHRVLTEKVFAAQATVLTADAFIQALG